MAWTREEMAARAAREELRDSAKDGAENVMIVDLMRNDLGRVCEYGTVAVEGLCEVEPAAGVWHLVSTVSGRLRHDVGDGTLLRATFPPGSVTGAPKVQALRMIHDLELGLPSPDLVADVVVVGAGAAGIALAVELARRGRQVTLLDARTSGKNWDLRTSGVTSRLDARPGGYWTLRSRCR